ncbi:MAG: inorganic diphosphatase [Candidatus Spechtbacterales bacterium]|nr:inorganic diphosphatase [Candidatus Spechtbacterales bacterium]
MKISKLSKGKEFPEKFNVLVEIPKGSSVKYDFDHDSGLIEVDRFISSAMAYPFNYGHIPETESGDGDPLDVIFIASRSVHPGVIVKARPIGMLEMEDESGIDNKIIAVGTHHVDPFFINVDTVEDLSSAVREEIRHFYEHYKELEPKKWVKIKNFHGKEVALEEIKKSVDK